MNRRHPNMHHTRHPKSLLLICMLAVSILPLPSPCRAQKRPEAAVEPPPAICTPLPDDDAIYSAALTKVILKDRNDRRQLVLLSQTSSAYPPGMAAFTASSTPDKKELLDAASTATKNDFDAKAKLNCDLTTNAALSAGVVFMSPTESDEFFSKASGWKDFAAKYPNAAGFTIVSAIAFDASHRQALVYVGNSCGMLCGTGYVVLLEKRKDKWVAAKTAKIWNASASQN
jgi:hypothetical protein